MIEIILSADGSWQDKEDWQQLAEQAVHTALAQMANAPPSELKGEMSVCINLSDDEEIHALNKQWRGKDRATNVLSFPMLTADEIDRLLQGEALAPEVMLGEIMLGDIILARETCVQEAEDKSIALSQHISHLIVHGTLHLMGHDHIEASEAEAMEALEIKALASMGLPNPYS